MKKLTIAIAIAVATCAVSLYATPTPYLQIFDGTTTIKITDNGVGDQNPLVGAVLWTGTIGVWDINVDQGLTKPILGSATQPHMDLSFSAHSTAAGTLNLQWVDSGFTFTGTAADAIGGTAFGTVTDCIRVNNVVVMQQGPFGPGAFSGTVFGGLSLTPSSLLDLQVYINHSGSGLTTGDKDLTTPDSGSAVALLGIALAGIEVLRRKIRAAR